MTNSPTVLRPRNRPVTSGRTLSASLPDGIKKMLETAQAALAQPFVGISTIEFDHQRGVALDNDAPSRQHIHTVVRTPNGNDYGMDLLRQHRQQFDHARL
jgi:Protein of unknown function (DUF3500)